MPSGPLPQCRFRRASVPCGLSFCFLCASVSPAGWVRRRAPEGGWGRVAGAGAGRGACITRQLRAFASAVPCEACHTCVDGTASRDGSVVELCMSRAATRPRDDRTHPQLPAVSIRWLSAIQGCAPAGHGCPAERPHGRRAKRGPKTRHSATRTARVPTDRCHSGANMHSAAGEHRVLGYRGWSAIASIPNLLPSHLDFDD